MPRFSQNLTRSGILCLSGGVAAIALAWTNGNALAFSIGYTLLFGLLFHCVFARLCIQKLEVELTPAARHARAYAPFPFDIQLRNRSKWLPVHSPKLKIVESGRRREFTLNVSQSLEPSQYTEMKFYPQFGRRGRQRLVLAEAFSYFPFGLTRSRKAFSSASPFVKVWPERSPIAVEVFQSWEYQSLSSGPPRRSPAVDEIDRNRFRDYQPGDSMRRINWKLSAKTNKLIVSENPYRPDSCFWLLINTHPSNWRRPVDFENGIRLLASALEFGFKRRTLAGLGINGERMAIRSHSDWVNAMDRVSELKWDENVNPRIPEREPGEFLVHSSKTGIVLSPAQGRRISV